MHVDAKTLAIKLSNADIERSRYVAKIMGLIAANEDREQISKAAQTAKTEILLVVFGLTATEEETAAALLALDQDTEKPKATPKGKDG